MKIICVNNFGNESVSDKLVAENVNEYYAEIIAAGLNSLEGDNSPNYYKAVEDNHKLYKFKP